MVRRGTRAFVTGAAAAAVAGALLTTGLLRGGTDPVGTAGHLFRLPAAAAEELPAFADCEQLRRWYVDRALPDVGAYGFGGGPVVPMFTERSAGVPAADSAAGTGAAVGTSGTGTNTQEAGVDEGDVAKTDGSLVVQVAGRDLVVTDVSGQRPRELSRTPIPGPALDGAGLLLRDRTVLVVGDEVLPGWRGGPIVQDRAMLPGRPPETHARLVSFDLGDPAAPWVTGTRVVDGGAVSTREYGDGTVRVVVTTGFPPLDFVQPNRDRTAARATLLNRRIVRDAPLSAWVPGVRDDGGARHPLVDCGDVRHPRTASGFGTISVLSFPFGEPRSGSTTAVTAAGDLVYSSAHRLYVATEHVRPRPVGDVVVGGTPGPESRTATAWTPTTQVHAFALDADRTSYLGTGRFRGLVRDRWSMSEHDGHLRVAVQRQGPQGRVDNGVVVLGEDGDRLEVTGRLDGLGRDETIQSVRWFDDLAVVVTFRQTDPLFTVDLSDPAHPRLEGTLRIPGFSSYLHPLGDGLLLGLGQAADGSGTTRGAQAATFDLADRTSTRRLDTLDLGPMSQTTVAWEPHAFSYLPGSRTFLTTVQRWTGGSEVVAVHVGRDGSLSRTGSWVSRRWADETVRTLPLDDHRVAVVGDVVRVVDVR